MGVGLTTDAIVHMAAFVRFECYFDVITPARVHASMPCDERKVSLDSPFMLHRWAASDGRNEKRSQFGTNRYDQRHSQIRVVELAQLRRHMFRQSSHYLFKWSEKLLNV